jgi:hypothetical protein
MELNINVKEKVLQDNVIRPNETEFIKCSNCNKDLLQIVNKKISGETFYKMVVQCPFCGDKSWETEVKGKVGIHPCAGVALTYINEKGILVTYLTEKTK